MSQNVMYIFLLHLDVLINVDVSQTTSSANEKYFLSRYKPDQFKTTFCQQLHQAILPAQMTLVIM